jgi:type VI secretion system protein ImpM
MPILGDFVSRRLPSGFVRTWDHWLQNALKTSRQDLGSHWLDIYLTSPMWRFFLSPGICGEEAWAGILMPSVDSVGRYFPLTLAASIERPAYLPQMFLSAMDWFLKLEQLALSVLENDVDVDKFDRDLRKVMFPVHKPAVESAFPKILSFEENEKAYFHIDIIQIENMDDAFIRLSAELLIKFIAEYSLWGTTGSEHIEPCLKVFKGLPPAEAFSEFLAGRIDPKEYLVNEAFSPSTAGERIDYTTKSKQRTVDDNTVRIRWRSFAQSITGKVRKKNEDAYLERSEVGLWAVADGMGGHRAGEVASQAVVTALSTVPSTDTLESFVESVVAALQKVDAELIEIASQWGPDQILGTTVVVFLAVGDRCTAVWAGDSRLHRYRGGVLSQLTQDHSLVSELSQQNIFTQTETSHSVNKNIITRAVGVTGDLQFDQIDFEAMVGDTYLLCSDGLEREVSTQEIEDIIGGKRCERIAQNLIDLALSRGARDNVTVVVLKAE